MPQIMDILRLVGSFVMIVLILVLTWVLTRWYARRMGAQMDGRYMRVVDKTILMQGCMLLIVQIQDDYYLVSAGDKGAQTLEKLDNFVETQSSAPNAPFSGSFLDLLNRAKKDKENGGAPK